MSTDPTPIPAYGEHRRRHDPEGSTWPYCAADDAPWPCETVSAFAAGLAAGRTADIPGWAHEQGVSFDGDTYWLWCGFCDGSIHPIDAGDCFEEILTKSRNHHRTCGAARVAESGADHA